MIFRIAFCIAILGTTAVHAQDEVKRNLYYGNQAFVEGDYEEATAYYTEAVAVSPLDFKANYNLANAYFRLGEHDKAIERLTAVTSLAPSSYDKSKAFHNLGNAHMMKQDLDGAIDAYKEALRLNPSDEETRYNLAYAQLLKQEQDQQDQENNGEGGDKTNGNPNENDGEPQDNENDEEGDNDQNSGNNDTQEGDNGDQESNGNNPDQKTPRDQDGNGQGYSSKLSKEQIENILDMYYRKERDVQKKVDKNRRFGYGSPKKKDW